MLKPLIAATAVLGIAGSSIVYAQQSFGEHHRFDDGGQRTEHRHRPDPQERAAFTDARIAALKAGLELTPEQAKNWPAFEQALRDLAQQRAEAREADRHPQTQGDPTQQPGQPPQQAQTPHDPFNRLGQRADTLGKTSAALKKVADAGEPLYQSLTDAQKERFGRLARMLRPHFRQFAFNDEHGGWRHSEHGFGRDRDGDGPGHRRFGPERGGPDSQL